MNNTFMIFAALFIVSLIIRTCYELLKRAGKANPKSKLLFIIIFLTMCLLWICWFGMGPLDPWKVTLSSLVSGIGLGIFILGWVLAIGALLQLRGLENIDHLVTTGLFSRIRHPMYTGFIMWIIGWSIYHSALASFIAGLAGIVTILYWRHLEENYLISTYGESFLHYRRGTWF